MKFVKQVALLLLLISWVILIAAMAQGGPVTMIEVVEQHPAGTCQNDKIELDKEYCAVNPVQCNEFMQNCIADRTSAANHHCNAAMTFLIFSCK